MRHWQKRGLTAIVMAGLVLTAFPLPVSAFDLDSLIPSIFSRKPAVQPPPEPLPKPRAPRQVQQRAPFAVPTSDSEKPSPDATTVVTVIGDSLGIQLGQGLREALRPRPEFGLVNRARGNTGLVNTSERDWPKFVRDLTSGTEKNNLTIIMIGSNDNQPIRDELGALQEPMSEKWVEIYSKRVDELLAPLQERKIPVIWVGLPATKYEKLTMNFVGFNKIYRERVQKAGMTYVDIWDAFVDEQGRYDASGPDVAGETVKLRVGDGVHFTKPGYKKLAFFVEREVVKAFSTTPKEGEAAMPEELREQIRLQSGPPPANVDIRNAVPLPDIALPAPELQKREAGPIVPLTSQPVAASGTLLQARADPFSGDPQQKDAAKLAKEVFVIGKAQYPKPNRGDDFGWPRR